MKPKLSGIDLPRRPSMSSQSQWTRNTFGCPPSPSGGGGGAITASTSSPGLSSSGSGYALSPLSLSRANSFSAKRNNHLTRSPRAGLLDGQKSSVKTEPDRNRGQDAPEKEGADDSEFQLPDFDDLHLNTANESVTTPRANVDKGKEGPGSDYMSAGPAGTSKTQEQVSPTREESNTSTVANSMTPIEADVLLPFIDRPTEVKDLLEQTSRNRAVFELLVDTFTPKSESAAVPHDTKVRPDKWQWEQVQHHLSLPREKVCDQDWIDGLKACVYPKNQLLWERLRACLGVDVDDERGTDRYEPLSSDIILPADDTPYTQQITPSPSVDLSPRAILKSLGETQADPATTSPNLGLAPVEPGAASTPTSPRAVLSSYSSSPAARERLHRRTSSGGSFRRGAGFAMSAISEDKPVNDFRDEEAHSIDAEVSPNPSSFSSFSSSPAFGPPSGDSRVQLGDLLRLRGYAVDQKAPAISGGLSTSTSSSSLGGYQPASPMASSPSSLGLNMLGRRKSIDYNSVFGSEDEGSMSISGSARSTGRGPGLRTSFSAADAAASKPSPLASGFGLSRDSPRSGFALAGLNFKRRQGSVNAHDFDTPTVRSPVLATAPS